MILNLSVPLITSDSDTERLLASELIDQGKIEAPDRDWPYCLDLEFGFWEIKVASSTSTVFSGVGKEIRDARLATLRDLLIFKQRKANSIKGRFPVGFEIVALNSPIFQDGKVKYPALAIDDKGLLPLRLTSPAKGNCWDSFQIILLAHEVLSVEI